MPKRFLHLIRWSEYLSSGENLAGCAEKVGLSSSSPCLIVPSMVYTRLPLPFPPPLPLSR
eukprot:CAMPEP_0115105516 /NCGR_PEP_ID=MMETSP0227-20121206/36044_1 /TAXON_ID=89957 /ORGANISM="Polarella glacialis, Strain CCMP 1383" /LENGTH=59 /DNA_ID=CAMNT_0002502813 /DNA_START=50 /DNA_END=229 /DNA_ORIENTATION=+